MKIHFILKDFAFFLLISAFFIVPPLCAGGDSAQPFAEWTFPLPRLVYALAAAAILFAERRRENGIPCAAHRADGVCSAAAALTGTGSFLLAFGQLCAAAALLELSAWLTGNAQSDISVALPDGAAQVCFCALNFALSAFCEEAVYRVYLPENLLKFTAYLSRSKGASLCAEILPAALFALSHRYLGAFAVINAAAAHIFLRLCFCKSRSVWPGTAAHFCYNILSLLLLR